MKNILFFLLFCFCSTVLLGQEIERQVIATGGDYFENGTAQLSQTIGEPINEFLQDATTHLTQGFQQGEYELPVLPVELLTFRAARMNDKQVQLTWQIMTTNTLDFFEIERQLAGENHFSFIQKLSFTEVALFEYFDENNSVEKSYYRLKIVEKDGTFNYSKIRTVTGVPLENMIQYYPNPVEGMMHFSIFPDARLQYSNCLLQVFDAQGKLIAAENQGVNTTFSTTIFEPLAAGNYLLILTFDDRKAQQFNISKL